MWCSTILHIEYPSYILLSCIAHSLISSCLVDASYAALQEHCCCFPQLIPCVFYKSDNSELTASYGFPSFPSSISCSFPVIIKKKSIGEYIAFDSCGCMLYIFDSKTSFLEFKDLLISGSFDTNKRAISDTCHTEFTLYAQSVQYLIHRWVSTYDSHAYNSNTRWALVGWEFSQQNQERQI